MYCLFCLVPTSNNIQINKKSCVSLDLFFLCVLHISLFSRRKVKEMIMKAKAQRRTMRMEKVLTMTTKEMKSQVLKNQAKKVRLVVVILLLHQPTFIYILIQTMAMLLNISKAYIIFLPNKNQLFFRTQYKNNHNCNVERFM